MTSAVPIPMYMRPLSLVVELPTGGLPRNRPA